ncbi:MAG: restriction endonuclease [Desulfopila sp.]|nr:restriction endonuclease [Desulfopila sp.]
MSRRNFALFVREYFSRRGFSIAEVREKSADGSVFMAVKDEEKYLVYCLWNTSGEVAALKKLLEMVSEVGARGGIGVSSTSFSRAAAAFAGSGVLSLVDGAELHRNIRTQLQPDDIEYRQKRRCAGRRRWLYVILAGIAIAMAALSFTRSGGGLSFSLPERLGEILRTVGWTGEKERRQQSGNDPEDQVVERYRYEIELHTGGWMHCDDIVNVTEAAVTCRGGRGLEVSLQREEVKTIKRIRANE